MIFLQLKLNTRLFYNKNCSQHWCSRKRQKLAKIAKNDDPNIDLGRATDKRFDQMTEMKMKMFGYLGIFYGHLVHLMAIWYILWSLVYFSCFGMLHQ
jgi:hypothetical protein